MHGPCGRNRLSNFANEKKMLSFDILDMGIHIWFRRSAPYPIDRLILTYYSHNYYANGTNTLFQFAGQPSREPSSLPDIAEGPTDAC